MYYLAGPATGTSIKMTASPEAYTYVHFISIDRNLDHSVYLQVANQIIQAIIRGQLKPGSQLIGTRQLAEQLQIHRNTAKAAYDELLSQGWVEVIANRGTFVAPQIPETSGKAVENMRYPQATGFDFKRSFILDSPFEHTRCDYLLNDGIPDIRLTQIDDLSRLYSANLKRRSNRKKMGYYNQDGSEYFKEQLMHYLKGSRALDITPQNILISRSMEMSLYIISEIILSAGDQIVVTNPSYFSANMIFQNAGCRIHSIPMNEDGMDMDALEELCKRQTIRMVYLSPQNHYPTTVSLSAKRRMEILQLAKKYNFIIVEDDHDYDFQYDKPALMPLAAHDADGMVIYVSSFGKSLAPGFRAGFIVCPSNLMAEMRKYLGLIDRQGDILMEQALGEMIEEGAIHRHLKKSLKVYRERRNAMAVQLSSQFLAHFEFQIPNGGLAFWLTCKEPINLLRLSQIASQNQLFIPKTLLYQQKNLTAIRVGFGNMNTQEMENTLGILKYSMEWLQQTKD